eukprot:24520_1
MPTGHGRGNSRMSRMTVNNNDNDNNNDIQQINSSKSYVRRRTLMESIAYEQKRQSEHKEDIPQDYHINDNGHGDNNINIEHEHSHSKGAAILHKMLLPWTKLFSWTLPEKEGVFVQKHIYLTIMMLISWLGLLTFFVVDCSEKIGHCFNIPGDLLGITLLAIGSSLPDCFSSILAAKQGKGEMAVSNALGSNVFDINICIGVSFLLKSIMSSFNSIIVERDEGFELFIAALFVLLAIFMVAMFCYGLVLNKIIGAGLLAAYAVFLGAFCYLLQYD